ncbi:unnamed protein product [Discula destructiva]
MSSYTSTNDNNALSVKDANVPMPAVETNETAADTKMDLEYHRQVLKSKMEAQESTNNYISPSDEIMSPCTAKLSAMRNKQVGKIKPKSLFAQASSKRLNGQDGLFGSKAKPAAPVSPAKE